METALLNQKYLSQINQIQISGKNEESLTLKKSGDFWLLYLKKNDSANSLCTLADGKIINSLLDKACKIRNIYLLSKNPSSYPSFALDDEGAFSLSFFKNDNSLCTKIYFGSSNSLTNRIYFRSQGKENVYECQNDFSQYLNFESSYWAEGRILSEIEKIQKVTGEIKGEVKNSSKENISDFDFRSEKFLSLRHGKIFLRDSLPLSQPILKIRVEGGNSRLVSLNFYQGEENLYFYTKNVLPSPEDSQENAFALYSDNGAYEISQWTYERIKESYNF